MRIPDDLLYTKEHEWVRIKGNTATIGITDYAQGSLGDITFVELPKPGGQVQQFKQYATVESVKAASDIYSPVSGKITAVNEKLSSNPELINKSPYEDGYFAAIGIFDEKDASRLMPAADYKKYVDGLS